MLRRKDTIIRGQTYNPRYEEHLEPIINSMLFTKSEDSIGVQLADFVAKTMWFKWVNQKEHRFDQIEKLFFRLDGSSFTEPCIIPH